LIGGLDSNDQAILTNFYNSLTSRGSLNWNVMNDLCGQTGVNCDTSNPKRVYQLYAIPFFFFFFLFFLFVHINEQNFDIVAPILMKNRQLYSQSLSGTIPTEFRDLTKLQTL